MQLVDELQFTLNLAPRASEQSRVAVWEDSASFNSVLCALAEDTTSSFLLQARGTSGTHIPDPASVKPSRAESSTVLAMASGRSAKSTRHVAS